MTVIVLHPQQPAAWLTHTHVAPREVPIRAALGISAARTFLVSAIFYATRGRSIEGAARFMESWQRAVAAGAEMSEG